MCTSITKHTRVCVYCYWFFFLGGGGVTNNCIYGCMCVCVCVCIWEGGGDLLLL